MICLLKLDLSYYNITFCLLQSFIRKNAEASFRKSIASDKQKYGIDKREFLVRLPHLIILRLWYTMFEKYIKSILFKFRTGKHFLLSSSYICTAFKKYIGVSITQHRHEAKLQYAYSLILTSGLSIDAIAEQCGFDSRPYFYKEFKKKYGIVPGYLRKKQKN